MSHRREVVAADDVVRHAEGLFGHRPVGRQYLVRIVARAERDVRREAGRPDAGKGPDPLQEIGHQQNRPRPRVVPAVHRIDGEQKNVRGVESQAGVASRGSASNEETGRHEEDGQAGLSAPTRPRCAGVSPAAAPVPAVGLSAPPMFVRKGDQRRRRADPSPVTAATRVELTTRTVDSRVTTRVGTGTPGVFDSPAKRLLVKVPGPLLVHPGAGHRELRRRHVAAERRSPPVAQSRPRKVGRPTPLTRPGCLRHTSIVKRWEEKATQASVVGRRHHFLRHRPWEVVREQAAQAPPIPAPTRSPRSRARRRAAIPPGDEAAGAAGRGGLDRAAAAVAARRALGNLPLTRDHVR